MAYIHHTLFHTQRAKNALKALTRIVPFLCQQLPTSRFSAKCLLGEWANHKALCFVRQIVNVQHRSLLSKILNIPTCVQLPCSTIPTLPTKTLRSARNPCHSAIPAITFLVRTVAKHRGGYFITLAKSKI